MANTFVENVNVLANATALATGDIVEDTQTARDEAVSAAANAKVSENNSKNSESMSQAWAENGHNAPVQGTIGIDAEFSSYHWATEASLTIGDPLINDLTVSSLKTWSSLKISNELALKSDDTHLHTGVYEPVFTKNSAFNKDFGGTGVGTNVARDDHNHDTMYEPKRTVEGTAYNKDFGTTSGTVMEGDTRFDGDYMPLAAQNTAYNKPFVVDANAPLADEVPRGNHGHQAAGISYDNTGNIVITSTTNQGAISQLDSAVGAITVAEKCKITAGMTNPTQVVDITGTGIPAKVVTAMTVSSNSKNALYSGGDLTINYPVDPDKLVEGWFSAAATISVESSIEYAMGIAINDVVVDSSFNSELGSSTNNTAGDFAFSLDGFVSGLSNGDRISVVLYNMTNANDITLLSHTVSFAGEPEGSLVISGSTVTHNDTIGRDAAQAHPTTSIYDTTSSRTLDDLLTDKADKVVTPVTNNLLSMDANGNLQDSGTSKTVIDGKMSLVAAPTLDNIVAMTSGGDSKDTGIKVTDLAAKNGSSAEVFEVSCGTNPSEAVNKSQLDAVQAVADGAIPKVPTPTAGNYVLVDANGDIQDAGGSPSDFATAVHGHAISDTTGLQDALDGKYAKVITPITGNIPTFGVGEILEDSGLNEALISGAVQKSGDTMIGNLEAPSMSIGGNYLTPYTMRNKIINGGFDVWQRGTSFGSIVNGAFSADRWLIGSAGAAPTVYQGVESNLNSRYSLVIDGSSGNTAIEVIQRVESFGMQGILSGDFVTVSFELLLVGLTSKDISVRIMRPNNYDDWSAKFETVDHIFTDATTGSYNATLQIPSEYFRWGLELAFLCGGLDAGQTIVLSNVQLEEGSVATPFEQRPIGMELALCHRYYEEKTLWLEAYSSANAIISMTNDYVEKRVIPNTTITDNGSVFLTGVFGANAPTKNSLRMTATKDGTTSQFLFSVTAKHDAEIY